MEDDKREYPEPIFVSCKEGRLSIDYDQVHVDIPEGGEISPDAPSLARRVFRAVRADLETGPRAE